MTVNDLIIYLQKLQAEGRGGYKIQAHNIDYNTANGGNYCINENSDVFESVIEIKEDSETVIFGEYNEYYSY